MDLALTAAQIGELRKLRNCRACGKVINREKGIGLYLEPVVVHDPEETRSFGTAHVNAFCAPCSSIIARRIGIAITAAKKAAE